MCLNKPYFTLDMSSRILQPLKKKDCHVETCLSSLLLHRTRGDRQLKDGEVMYPVGYSDKPVPDTSVQEADRNLVEKVKLHDSNFNRSIAVHTV